MLCGERFITAFRKELAVAVVDARGLEQPRGRSWLVTLEMRFNGARHMARRSGSDLS